MSKQIEDLEKNIQGAKVLLKKYEKAKNDKMASRIKEKIERNEKKIAELKKSEKPSKPKSTSISGSMSKEKCIEFLNELAKKEGIKKQNEEFKNALKRAGWANVEDINWDYDSPEWNKKEEK